MNNCKRRPALSPLLALSLAAALCLAASASASAVTISPLPGTPTAMPQTQISFLGASAGALSSISVVGSASGRHSGRLRAYSSATGASFLPSRPFTPGERVTVHARWSVGKQTRPLSTFFTVAHPVAPPTGGFPTVPGTEADVQRFLSKPNLDPPTVTIHQASAGLAPGYVFAAPFQGPGQYGPMILDNAGRLVWFHPVPQGDDATDFKLQRFHGREDLTWWQGKTINLGYGLGEGVIVNSAYQTVAIVKAGNGLPADEHEFTVLENGAALITAYSPVRADLSAAGGPSSGIAVDCAVQEIDIHTGLVMWEWHSLGHVGVDESYSKPPATPDGYYDYFHLNSIELLKDGNFLISARNTWGLYEVSAHTGAVIWRLGGKKSSFVVGAGVQFAWQHDARMLPDGEISLFDDEGAPPIHPPTRGEFVKLDTKARTATLAGQLVRTSGPLITGSQGDVQALPDGNWMLGWGGLPNFTEFNGRGQIVFDGQFPSGEDSYRVYREPWSGQPGELPAIVARTTGSSTAVYASWNGATEVASWQLLTGSSASHLTAVSTTPKRGFETMIPAPASALVQVRALSASGRALRASKVVRPTGG